MIQLGGIPDGSIGKMGASGNSGQIACWWSSLHWRKRESGNIKFAIGEINITMASSGFLRPIKGIGVAVDNLQWAMVMFVSVVVIILVETVGSLGFVGVLIGIAVTSFRFFLPSLL